MTDTLKHSSNPSGREMEDLLAEPPLRRVLSFYLRAEREKRAALAAIRESINDTYRSQSEATSRKTS